MHGSLDLDENGSFNKAKVVTEWLNKAKINVMEWPSQSPEVKLIENLLRELQVRINARHPKNINEAVNDLQRRMEPNFM